MGGEYFAKVWPLIQKQQQEKVTQKKSSNWGVAEAGEYFSTVMDYELKYKLHLWILTFCWSCLKNRTYD